MGRVKYPLTDEAKEWARRLVQNWDNGKIEQYIEIRYDYQIGSIGLEAFALFGVADNFEPPSNGVILELSQFNLISTNVIREDHGFRYIVLLLQELRNAVASDFEVSDYFLTFNAVGTIINAAEGSTLQLPSLLSVGEVSGGSITHTVEYAAGLVEELERIIGDRQLETNGELQGVLHRLKAVLGIGGRSEG